jgi:hypothetical protein
MEWSNPSIGFSELKSFLDEKTELYNTPDFIGTDPIQVPHQFSQNADIEIAAFLTATLAWGQKTTIISNATKLLSWMPGGPHEFILNAKEKDLNSFLPFVHRTFNGIDCIYFLNALGNIYRHHGGLRQLLEAEYALHEDLFRSLVHFREVFFSAAIPGLLHYDMTRDDPRMEGLLTGLMERDDVVALVDGGVANNVPAGPAWRQVQDGRIGTRNAYYLAFDSFHPQGGLGHLWLQPLTRVVALQVATNERYAHRRIEFKPTLSPIRLLPAPMQLDRAVKWGREQMADELPLLQKFFERVRWVPPANSE